MWWPWPRRRCLRLTPRCGVPLFRGQALRSGGVYAGRDCRWKTTRAEFLQQYYAQRTVPPQVTLDGEVEGKEALRQWLSEKAGRISEAHRSPKGRAGHLVDMCRRNASEKLAQQAGRTGREMGALDELAGFWALPSRRNILKPTISPTWRAAEM